LPLSRPCPDLQGLSSAAAKEEYPSDEDDGDYVLDPNCDGGDCDSDDSNSDDSDSDSGDDSSVSGDSDGSDTIITPNAKRHKCDRVRSGKVSKLADGKRHRGIGGKQLTPKQMSNARLKILNPKASYKWRGVTYPNMVAETFEIRFGRVWCCACRKHVHLKRLAQHIHGSGKDAAGNTLHKKNVAVYMQGGDKQQ
jgi:hypothetical protein